METTSKGPGKLFGRVLIYFVPLAAAAAVKVGLFISDSLPFNADEAIVALMARHINQGNIPRFFYGQAYLGSLDAVLVSIGFRIFGEWIWVIRAVQSLLYLGTVYSTVLLTKNLLQSRRAALFSGLLAAVPPVNVSLYTTVSLGGYGEALLFGNLLLLGGIHIINAVRNQRTIIKRSIWIKLWLWGIGAGFSFWVFGLTLIYIIPVMVFVLREIGLLYKNKQFWLGILIVALGAIIGSSPWWTFAFHGNWKVLVSELAGSAIAGSQNKGMLSIFSRIGSLIVLGGSVVIGLRPPWGVQWLMLPILPFVLIFWLAVIVHIVQQMQRVKVDPGLMMLCMMSIILLIGFVFSPYGGDPSGRYFLPLALPLAIFGGDFIEKRFLSKPRLQISCLIFILFFNLGGTIQSGLKNPPGLTTQFDPVTQIDQNDMDDLIVFLKSRGELRGYTNYWVSYPLAFLSAEEIIYLPRLPYHEDFRYTSRDDRYPPYRKQIKKAQQIAYITTNHPELNSYLRSNFEDQGITWNEIMIGDFQIYYDLSAVVRPQDIGLGRTTNP